MLSRDVATFDAFVEMRRGDLRKIAHRTNGELDVEDIQQSAWLVAHQISRRRGFPVNFSDVDDQELVLGWLHNKYVAYAEKITRYAVSFDAPVEGADGEEFLVHPAVLRLLRDSAGAGPLELLEAAEQAEASFALLRQSYSEAVAYVWLLLRFQWSVEALAADLRVVVATLRQRMQRAAELLPLQPSLFDGRDVIDPDFHPTRQRRYAMKVAVIWQDAQACWQF